MDDETEIYEPAAAIAFLRRRLWVIVAATLVGVLAGYFISAQKADRYDATATLLFRDPGLDARVFDSSLLFGGAGLLGSESTADAETNLGLVNLDDVYAETARRLPELGLTPAGVDDRIVVQGGGSDQLVDITGQTPDPATSALIANTYAASFLALRTRVERATYGKAVAAVRRRLAQADPASAGAARLRSQLHQLEALQLTRTGAAELVQRATPPTEKAAPKPAHAAAVAGAAGLLFGLLVAVLLDAFDRRLSTRRQLEHAYGARVVGMIPRGRGAAGEAASAAFGDLARRLLNPPPPATAPRVLLVLSARRAEGPEDVAAGLLAALHDAGLEAELVDGTSAGPEALARPEGHGVLLITGPPLGEGTGSVPLLAAADAILIVVVPEQPAAAAAAMMRELEGREVAIAGLVVNGARNRRWAL